MFYTYVHKHSTKPSTKFVLQKKTLVFFPLVFFKQKAYQQHLENQTLLFRTDNLEIINPNLIPKILQLSNKTDFIFCARNTAVLVVNQHCLHIKQTTTNVYLLPFTILIKKTEQGT